MALEIKIPKLGLTMTEATLVNWLIDAGSEVAQEQVICLIETDKVNLEMQAPGPGLLHPVVEAGRRVAVGEIVGFIATDREELETLRAKHAGIQTAAAETLVSSDTAVATEVLETQPALPATCEKAPGNARLIATPAAKKAGKDLGIDLNLVSGSGPGGRIVLEDVQKAVTAAADNQAVDRYDFTSPGHETELLSAAQTIPIRGIRKIIARNMMLSLASQAQLTLHTETSAASMLATRKAFNNGNGNGKVRVSYNAILVKAVAQALRLHPLLNAVVEGREIRIWDQIHIGLAMDFGQGLLVPKIRDADTKSITAISAELNDLAERAKNKRLLPDELQSGTFTITNLGHFDIDAFTPILNFPESAILGVGRIVEKPSVRDGAVVVEPLIGLSLTFDHRIIDGALAAQFLKTVKDRIEETRLML